MWSAPWWEKKRATVLCSCQQENYGNGSLFRCFPKWSRQWSKQIRTAQQRHFPEAESPKVREPRTFHTKLMHSVVYSWELSQPRGSTIPNHNEICIIRQSQDQSQMIVRMTTSLLQLVACVDYQSAQDFIDPENLSIDWFCLANIYHSFHQQHLTFNYSWLCYL